jgi:hypothetical protein
MKSFFWDSNNKKTCLNAKITCDGKQRIRIIAEESDKPNSKYCDRVIEVNGTKDIYLSFPVSPKAMIVKTYNLNSPNQDFYDITFSESPLIMYNVWQDEETLCFLQFALQFCQTCGFQDMQPPKGGKVYRSDCGRFTINYVPVIKDAASGSTLNTPSRIGHSTGRIDVSAYHYNGYTIPARLCILLHEYSHKYRNPKIQLKISDEFGADINSLYFYMGNSFSKIDAIYVYAQVFLKAQTDQNIMRMRKIRDYIYRFEQGQFAQILK